MSTRSAQRTDVPTHSQVLRYQFLHIFFTVTIASRYGGNLELRIYFDITDSVVNEAKRAG
jgi:hypothetical protein